MTRPRGLVAAIWILAILLAANAVLGPLLLGVIDYRYGEAMTNQGIGLDAVTLLLAVPVAVVAALLVRRGYPSGAVLAFAPATLAAYMAPQYVVGPDYLGRPGNNELFVPLHLAVLVAGLAVAILAWRALAGRVLPPDTRRGDRWRAGALLFVAAFTALGRWLPALAAVWTGAPGPDYLDNPTAFWLVATLDLGLVVPACVAVAIALLRRASWARLAAYALIGWFSLVPASVAAMAITMLLRDDPLGSVTTAVVMTSAGVVLTVAAVVLLWPVLRMPRDGAVSAPPAAPAPAPARASVSAAAGSSAR